MADFNNNTEERALSLMEKTGSVHPILWDKDHHSLILYVESRIVDHSGRLYEGHLNLTSRYKTRIAGDRKAPRHNDRNALLDLRFYGVLEYDEVKDTYQLTAPGWLYASELRRSQGQEGYMPDFALLRDKLTRYIQEQQELEFQHLLDMEGAGEDDNN